ncbi:MAG: lysophospholipid acyltransferase family protein [Planctomycetes bacterium]|nr:lysophospholipid acyltransferase family protein [Planctomycetota bacterium]
MTASAAEPEGSAAAATGPAEAGGGGPGDASGKHRKPWKRRLRRRLRELGLWTAVEYAQFLGFRLAEFAFAALPAAAGAALGRTLGRLAWAVLPRVRAESLKNLRLALGDALDDAGRADLGRRALEHLGAAVPDALHFPRRVGRAAGGTGGTGGASGASGAAGGGSGRLDRYAVVERLDLTAEALRAGRGVLWAVPHLGNWEFAGLFAAASGIPMSAVARPMPNRFIDAEVRRLRSRTGQQMLDRKGVIRDVLRALKAGGVVAMVLDVEPDEGGLEVPFFGRPTRFFETAGLLAVRTGCAVIPSWVRRDGPLRYRMGCAESLVARPGEPADLEIARITRAVAAHFEAFIRRSPEQYAWALRRWREGPRGGGQGPV